jgi:hypothetical protein
MVKMQADRLIGTQPLGTGEAVPLLRKLHASSELIAGPVEEVRAVGLLIEDQPPKSVQRILRKPRIPVAAVPAE